MQGRGCSGQQRKKQFADEIGYPRGWGAGPEGSLDLVQRLGGCGRVYFFTLEYKRVNTRARAMQTMCVLSVERVADLLVRALSSAARARGLRNILSRILSMVPVHARLVVACLREARLYG